LLERPSPISTSESSSGSSAPSSRDCPAMRMLLTPSNRLLLTWSSQANASNASSSSPGSAWKLAGRTPLEEREWHRVVAVGDASAMQGKGSCALYVFRAQDRAWRQEAFISPCNPAILTPRPPQRWYLGACAATSGEQSLSPAPHDQLSHWGFFPGFLDEVRISEVALPEHRWLWLR